MIGRFSAKGVQGDEVDTRAVQVWEFNGNAAVRVCTIADSAVFPEIVTEEKQREWEEEDRENEEREKREESEERDEPEGKGETDEDDEEDGG